MARLAGRRGGAQIRSPPAPISSDSFFRRRQPAIRSCGDPVLHLLFRHLLLHHRLAPGPPRLPPRPPAPPHLPRARRRHRQLLLLPPPRRRHHGAIRSIRLLKMCACEAMLRRWLSLSALPSSSAPLRRWPQPPHQDCPLRRRRSRRRAPGNRNRTGHVRVHCAGAHRGRSAIAAVGRVRAGRRWRQKEEGRRCGGGWTGG
ncbi:hypothetical protein DAI22_04g045600 [Oryza sativa Japonica Group]|nr:hypothetical protein DAI22_04g045600 [Oryza sativa Japonica Group]